MIHYSHFSSLIFCTLVSEGWLHITREGKRENSLLILKRLRKYFSLGKMQMNTKIFRQVSLSYLFSAPPAGRNPGSFFFFVLITGRFTTIEYLVLPNRIMSSSCHLFVFFFFAPSRNLLLYFCDFARK